MAFSKFRTHKYGAEKVSQDGYSFSSKLEASVYGLLKLQMLAKEIQSIQVQSHVYLSDARILYVPDFKCVASDGTVFYAEAKGFEAPRWPTIKKLWKFYGPAPLQIWKGTHLRPVLVETITPKEKK